MHTDVEAPDARTATIDPLRPLITVTRALALLLTGLLLVAGVAAIFGAGTIDTIGDDSVCATVHAGNEVPVIGTDSTSVSSLTTGLGITSLRSGATIKESAYQLCQDRPSLAARFASALSSLPDLIFLMGFLAAVLLLVRRAKRSGLFSRAVARHVHRLGWYVLAGALLVATVDALAQSALVNQMLASHHVLDVASYWHVSIATILAGAGILTIARVMHLSVTMAEDLDGTP